MLPTDPFFTHRICQVVTGTGVIFHSQTARPPICLSFAYNLKCPLLVPHLFPPHHRMFQWLQLLPHLNLPFVQASDISNSLPRRKTYVTCAWIVWNLIFVTFKPPASRSRAYCDCNPIRAFETFDLSKEPISKTSRFWMFWYKWGCNWLGAIKGMALCFARVTF